jgi:Tfp pilus assembly protein PilF
MRNNIRIRTLISLVLTLCLLSLPMTAFAKKGEKNFKRGIDYERSQQWDKAAQEFTLAVAADPSNVEYQLHFRRASFNASQTYMQQGRSLAERGLWLRRGE